MPGESQQLPPGQPDPTVLTTEQLLREVDNLDQRIVARMQGFKEVIEAVLDRMEDLRKMLDERYVMQTKAVEAAFQSQQTAMQTAFTAADQGVSKALDAQQKSQDKDVTHLTSLIEEKDVQHKAAAITYQREFHEHLGQVAEEGRAALASSEKAIEKAEVATQKAIDKAEIANDKRFSSVDEIRTELAAQATRFMPRTEVETQNRATASEAKSGIDRNSERINELTDRINRAEGKGAGLNAGWIYVLGALATLGTLVSIYLAARSGT